MSTIFQTFKKVKLSNEEEVSVSELNILDMLGLIKLLGSKASELVQASRGETIQYEKIVEIIAGSSELVSYLLEKSSGRTDYLAMDGLRVLEVAIEMNFREDLTKKFLSVGAKAGKLLGIQATKPENSSKQ